MIRLWAHISAASTVNGCVFLLDVGQCRIHCTTFTIQLSPPPSEDGPVADRIKEKRYLWTHVPIYGRIFCTVSVRTDKQTYRETYLCTTRPTPARFAAKPIVPSRSKRTQTLGATLRSHGDLLLSLWLVYPDIDVSESLLSFLSIPKGFALGFGDLGKDVGFRARGWGVLL
jgi:hypothetical protein